MKKKQEKQSLTVKDIKELQPLADIYELKSYHKYMIAIKKSSIISTDNTHAMQVAKEIMRICIKARIPVQIIANIDFNDVKFFEVS